jgi:separase
MVNSKKTHFILNPSGDLKDTQSTFEPFLKDMSERTGWKGVIGEKPSELEMTSILKNNDLVLYVSYCSDARVWRLTIRYFGHGGGEQYIRGNKVRTLPKCATTFLWGCSSGKLEDQGDLDSAGTAWNYMMAGWYVFSS